jgi:hypothetical protein
MMQLFPTPNISNGIIYDNWIASGATANSNDQFDVKIDYRFNEKSLLSANIRRAGKARLPLIALKTLPILAEAAGIKTRSTYFRSMIHTPLAPP